MKKLLSGTIFFTIIFLFAPIIIFCNDQITVIIPSLTEAMSFKKIGNYPASHYTDPQFFGVLIYTIFKLIISKRQKFY